MSKLEPIKLVNYPLYSHQPDEDNLAFEYFSKYYLPLAKRSVRAAYRRYQDDIGSTNIDKNGGNNKTWNEWSNCYQWELRAIAYHREMAQNNLLWLQEKQRQLIERELVVCDKLFNKAEQLLNMAINPDVDRIKDASTLIRSASEISRKSLAMNDLNQAVKALESAGLIVINPTTNDNQENENNV
jgi:hypothetical protein